jgi:hypothetical protein
MPVVISGTDNFVLNADSLGTAAPGAFDYDGKVFYATPQSTERGVVPGAQFFRLNSGLAGANVNTAQSVFGVGVTLSASTVYAFDYYVIFSKSAGATSHNFSIGFGGTATLNNILYGGPYNAANAVFTSGTSIGGTVIIDFNTAASTAISTGIASASRSQYCYFRGTVSVSAGGTFIPQYTLSAAPGGAYTTQAGSYFLIYPIGASGANISVGTWA